MDNHLGVIYQRCILEAVPLSGVSILELTSTPLRCLEGQVYGLFTCSFFCSEPRQGLVSTQLKGSLAREN